LRLVKRVAVTVVGRRRSAEMERNLAALAELRAALPEGRVRFVHVPDKFETARGRYDLDLQAAVEAAGIEYLPALERCTLTPGLYYARDNHLNRDGYRRLGECVGELLGLNTPSRTRREPAP
jgi:hypothetical protein